MLGFNKASTWLLFDYFSTLVICGIIDFLHVDKLRDGTAVFDFDVLLKLLTNLLTASIFHRVFDPAKFVARQLNEAEIIGLIFHN